LDVARYTIGLKEIAPLSYPIRSKTKTSRDSLARFPAFFAGDVFAWGVLIGSLDCPRPVIGQTDYFCF